MLVGKSYKIESDSLNVVISKKVKRTKKGGGKYDDWQIIGYYGTVQSALHELVNLKVKETELMDIKTITAEINKLHQLVEALPKRARGIREGIKQKSNSGDCSGTK